MTAKWIPLLVVFALIACSKGKKDNTPTSTLVNRDIAQADEWSAVFDQNSSWAAPFYKTFGGYSGKKVQNFIEQRVANPYSNEEILNFKVDIQKRNYLYTGTLRQLFNYKEDSNKKSQLLGVNYGTSLAQHAHEDNSTVFVYLPTGLKEVRSPRIGLIGVTENYFGKHSPTIRRLAILIHEGRHSDCSSFKNEDCGYSHRYCPPGHDLEGLAACDQFAWGPYAVELIYLKGMMNRYPEYSREYRIFEMIINDLSTRLNRELLFEIKNSHPNLKSI